jgi:segregation and condensation protein B
MDKEQLKKVIEAMLFAYGEPLGIDVICEITKADQELVEEAIDELIQEADYNMRGICIVNLGSKYQMTTRAQYYDFVQSLFKEYISTKLSQASLETLTIIAYKQPVTRPEIEAIRGVNSDSSVRNLADRGLIKEAGRKDVIGKPVMFETTDRFLLFSGISELSQLPDFEEFNQLIEEETKNKENEEEL